MNVRTFLPLCVWAVPMRAEFKDRPFDSCRRHAKRRERAAGVIRDEHRLVRAVNGNVARVGAAGWLNILLRQAARRRIAPKRSHGASFAAAGLRIILVLVYSVERVALGRHSQERRVRRFHREAQRTERAGMGVPLCQVDAVSLAARSHVMRVSADVELGLICASVLPKQ